jgi:hypothetical protein
MRYEADVPLVLHEYGSRPVAKVHPLSMPRYGRANLKTEALWLNTKKSEADARWSNDMHRRHDSSRHP